MNQYAELFRIAGMRQAALFSLIGRFGYVASGLSVLFLGTARLGIGTGGLAAGALTVGVALGAPIAGRLSTRYGTSRTYTAFACLSMTGTLLALDGAGRGSQHLFLAGCFWGGLTTPPIAAAMRALWPKAGLPDRLRTTANSFESVVTETLFVAVPPVIGTLAAIDPRLGLIIASGCVVLGGVGFASTGVVRRHLPATGGTVHRPASRVLSPPVVWLLCIGASTAAVAGAMDVTVVSALRASGSMDAAGYVLLAPALASVLGGVVYGVLPAERVPGQRLGLLLASWLLLFVLVAFQSGPWTLTAALFLAGLPMAAIATEEFALLGQVCAQERLQEVFMWAGSGANVGVALGSALAGQVAEFRDGSLSAWTPVAVAAAALLLHRVGAHRLLTTPYRSLVQASR